MQMSEPSILLMDEPGMPVTHGSLLQFSDDPIACMRRLHREHGDLAVLADGDQRLVFVFSPELNRHVLSDTQTFESRFFAVRGNRKSAQRRVTSGLLSQNGAEHRDGRRMMKEVFAKKILPAYHTTICKLSNDLTDGWQAGNECDLNSEMVQFMLRMTSALLFGLDDAEFALKLGHLIDRWAHRNHEIGMGALVSAPQFAQGYDTLLAQAEELETTVREMFSRHRSTQHEQLNILSLLFQSQQSEQHLTDDQLVGHATLLFAAAHLTTAHTFSWTLFLLSQHPQVLKKLQEELSSHVAGDIPTLEELEQLPYLDSVIKESMRVLPASSYSQRIVVQPTSIGPVRMNPGTPVIFSQYITHHRADLYEDPDRFIPERWASIAPSAYAYLPFGAGPRMCIGAPLAMVEIRTALTIMLKRFNFQIQPMSTVNGHVISTMLGPTSSIKATLLPSHKLPSTVPVLGSVHNLVSLPNAAHSKAATKAA
jgi:cytochrome P450